MFLNKVLTIQNKHILTPLTKYNIQMNNINMVLIVSSLITIIISASFSTTVQAVQFEQYGSIGQEDQLYTQDNNGLYYVNTGINYGIGNGSFEQINEINDHFTINGAIKTFGINEDTQSFIYEPVLSNGKYSDVLFIYELVGFNNFELTHIYADESGLNQELTELENNQ